MQIAIDLSVGASRLAAARMGLQVMVVRITADLERFAADDNVACDAGSIGGGARPWRTLSELGLSGSNGLVGYGGWTGLLTRRKRAGRRAARSRMIRRMRNKIFHLHKYSRGRRCFIQVFSGFFGSDLRCSKRRRIRSNRSRTGFNGRLLSVDSTCTANRVYPFSSSVIV